MDFPTLTLKRTSRRGRRPGGKSRRFSVRLLGYLAADGLWDCGVPGEEVRPAWIATFGSEAASGAFTANFRAGRKAKAAGRTFQMLKSAAYRWTRQRVPGGVVTVAYLPELFCLEPVEPFVETVRFILAPPRWWVEREAVALARRDAGAAEGAEEAVLAALFAAYVDRRTALPVLHDRRFHRQLYRAAEEAPWARRPDARRYPGAVLYAQGLEACGLVEPLAVAVPSSTFADWLTQQTSLYYEKEVRHGTSRRPADRGLLPDSPAAAVQLCLDFEMAASG